MNFRRVFAAISLDAGALVRELEVRVADLKEALKAEHVVTNELWIQTHDLEQKLADRNAQISNLRDVEATLTREIERKASQAVLLEGQLREQKSVSSLLMTETMRIRSINEDLEKQLTTERELLAETTTRAVVRINVLEIENDELRARIESGSDRQLELVPSPDAPEPAPEIVFDGEIVKVYQFAHVSFVKEHKWYFRDGGSEAFFAPIRDAEFNAKVASREITFASGDAVRVRLHQVTTRTGEQFKTVSEVAKVLGILPPAPEQINLLPEASVAP